MIERLIEQMGLLVNDSFPLQEAGVKASSASAGVTRIFAERNIRTE